MNFLVSPPRFEATVLSPFSIVSTILPIVSEKVLHFHDFPTLFNGGIRSLDSLMLTNSSDLANAKSRISVSSGNSATILFTIFVFC